jgi:hypothetical protein
MSDQITINVVPDSFVTVTAEEGNENVYLNPITLNQGIINHSTTHASGGSDELLHNALGGLNGGTSGQFYHLTSQEYSNLVTGQVIRPSDTGLFYASSNPSGFITGINDIVYTTGDQNIAGLKNFYTRPQVNGIGVLLSGEGGGGGSASGDYLPLSGGTLAGNLFVQGEIDATGVVSAPTYNLSLHDASITSESSVKTWAILSAIPDNYYPATYYFGSFSPRGHYFSNDGLFLYVLDSSNNTRSLYTVQLDVPWAIPINDYSTDYTIHIKDISSQISAPQGLYFSPDGTKLFIAGLNGANKILLKYNLLTPWDVSSTNATPDQTLDLTTPTGMSGVTDPRYVYFKSDGSKFFVANRSTSGSLSVLWEVSLSTNWDISAGSIGSTVSRNIDPSGFQSLHTQSALTFTADGKKMIIVARTGSPATYYLLEYTLSTAWSITDFEITYQRSVPSLFYDPQNTNDTTNPLLYLYYNSSAGKAYYPASNYGCIAEIDFDDSAVSTPNNLIVNGSISADYYGNMIANDIAADSIYASLGGISTVGNIGINSNTSYLNFGGTARMYGDSNGIVRLTDSNGTTFDKLRFGGTTNSFPSIRRNGSGLDIVVADSTNALTTLRAANTSFNNISGNACTLSGNLLVNSNSLFVNASTDRVGIGTISPTEKLTVLGNISGSGSVIINDDFESIDSTKGVVLKSPNGSRFRITIDNSGALTTTAL